MLGLVSRLLGLPHLLLVLLLFASRAEAGEKEGGYAREGEGGCEKKKKSKMSPRLLGLPHLLLVLL